MSNCSSDKYSDFATMQALEETANIPNISQNPELTSAVRTYKTLCGYLNKYSSRSFIKTAKRRWFVFVESNCKLYYYRSSTDRFVLGELDISKATFSFDATNKDKPAIFVISTPNKEVTLEAKDRDASLFWIQELQRWRRVYSSKQTKEFGNSTVFYDKNIQGISHGGLLAQNSLDETSQAYTEDDPYSLLNQVKQPEGVIGEESVKPAIANRPLSLAQQYFVQLRNQMVHSVTPAKQNHRLSDSNLPSVSFNSQDSTVSCLGGFSDRQENRNVLSPTAAAAAAPLQPPTNLLRTKSPSLSALRRKFQTSFKVKRSSSEAEDLVTGHRRTKSTDVGCHNCKEMNIRMSSLIDDISALEDELSASKEAIQIMHRKLETTLVERDTLMKVCQNQIPKSHLDLLREKEQQILILRHELEEERTTILKLEARIQELEFEVQKKSEQATLFQEMVQAKDDVVVSLTNEIFDLETEKRKQEKTWSDCSPKEPESPNTSLTSAEQLESFKDSVQAFEIQNRFLNKEILELNQLRRDAEERERSLLLRCSEWEAKCYQIQSKLLFLLKELDRPKRDGHQPEQTQEVVTRLLAEAMEESTSVSQSFFSPAWCREKDYDELGFNWKWGKEEDLLSTKAENLRERSQGITSKLKDAESSSLKVKWENFIVNLGSRELQRSDELKLLLRSGVPREYRSIIWRGCVQMRVKDLRGKLGFAYYMKLLSASSALSKFDPAVKQIELDLLRTLPNNKHYETLDSDGIPQLRKVLLAFSRHNPAVGYCQGINRLAAIALLFLDEEETFWLLVAVIEYIMPSDYYSKTLLASQVDQRVLKDLMGDKLPRLHAHLEEQNVDLSLYTFTWFLTVFVDIIPPETYLRIWDVFLYEGSKVLFRYALAFFKSCENDLLQLTDYMAINNKLRTTSEHMTDIKRLTQVAFGELNPFPMRMITTKRAHHMQLVKSQLEELEKIRSSIETTPRQAKDDCQSDDD